MEENLTSVFANNKGADQPAHSPCLISTDWNFSIISKLAASQISIFSIVSVAEQVGLAHYDYMRS